ncbi:acyltransferase family protein [Phytobacter sp. MRY16-398]|uniref:acyltransferase family protein n=1 Tax=Phytobacter sp. MRY16-398 TaxID=2487150 RepID=UPI000F63AD15|nr:acyltransferase [Phytobacter sp. MRY16-398]
MGFLRLFLALCVIAGHSRTPVFGYVGVNSWYAVNLFFIISGFYMAMVLNEKYKDAPVLSFYKSRALRLYPTYFVGLIIALIVSWDVYAQAFSLLSISSKILFVIQNTLIFGQDTSFLICAKLATGACQNPILMTPNPPAWSLSVELIFYIVAPFIVKSPIKTFAYFVFGLIYLLMLNFVSYPISSLSLFSIAQNTSFFYYWYPSSFVFFAMGAMGYQFSKGMISGKIYPIAIISFIASTYTVTIMPLWQMAIIGVAIPTLFSITKHNKIDRIIGEMSFPAYILHFPILTFIERHVSDYPYIFENVTIGTTVALCSCTIGLILYLTMEKYLDRIRHDRFSFSGSCEAPAFVKFIIIPAILSMPLFTIAYIVYQ